MKKNAAVVKLADTPDLGSGGEIRGGSSPSSQIGRAHVRTPVTSQSRMPSSA